MMDTNTFIKNMLCGGMSYGEIADMLGFTREEVKQIVSEMRKRGEIDAYDRPFARKVPLPEKVTELAREDLVQIEYQEKRSFRGRAEGITLWGLKPHHCRYLVTDKFFCGAPKKHNSSYCAHHHSIVWVPARGKYGAD